jgi:hypothetical protein
MNRKIKEQMAELRQMLEEERIAPARQIENA